MTLTYFVNKTKYFRLRLSDEVGTERPETDLRLTWDWPETDVTDLRQNYERKMKIQYFRQTYDGRTDEDCDSLGSLTEPKSKWLSTLNPKYPFSRLRSLTWSTVEVFRLKKDERMMKVSGAIGTPNISSRSKNVSSPPTVAVLVWASNRRDNCRETS